MLALPQRRQQYQPPTPPSSQRQFTYDDLSTQLSSLSANDLIHDKLLHDYLESQQQAFATPLIANNDSTTESIPFMTGSYDFSNPTIRVQQSTPTPQLPTAFSQPSMLSAANATAPALDSWQSSYANGGQMGSQSLQTPAQQRTGSSHQRAASSSSIGSSGSHYQSVGPTSSYPYVAHTESSPSSPAVNIDSSYNADEASRAFSNHLPTPTHTPTQDTFMNSNYNNYTPNTSGMDSTMAAHLSMKQALMDQHVPDDNVPDFAHSARHSVSSFGHDSPATPHTSHGDDFEDSKFKMPPSDLRHTVPKFERTYTDAAMDSLYDPSTYMAHAQSISQSKAANASLLSPYRSGNPHNSVQLALQKANSARTQSQSPSTSGSRGPSPFRQTSQYGSPRMMVATAQARERKPDVDAAYAMKQSRPEEAQPKTISPKDALLDYRETEEDSKVPLFPDSGASEYEHQYHSGDQYRNATQSNFDTNPGQTYRKDNWATPQFSPNFSAPVSGAASTPSFSFAPPAISGNMHGLPLTTSQYSQYRSTPSSMAPSASDQVPDFPAHLTSMESSASEAGPETSSTSNERLQKPAGSAADSGTYTCTYHGCTLRFETPQKLQKHKREGHRNPNTLGSGMTSAALDRNSQAGPHKCERINPTTGKPCNTIFSRPYDLTRHEDTIHNARKQKVRCALCVEEKTFSRNDALTRHMRVVHPDVDFPGKHRRRGANHD